MGTLKVLLNCEMQNSCTIILGIVYDSPGYACTESTADILSQFGNSTDLQSYLTLGIEPNMNKVGKKLKRKTWLNHLWPKRCGGKQRCISNIIECELNISFKLPNYVYLGIPVCKFVYKKIKAKQNAEP